MKPLRTKKKAVMLIAGIAAVCSFSAPAVAATVSPLNNHADTSWSTYMSNGGVGDTPNRQKQDNSSTYIYADNVSGGRTLFTWALGYSNDDVGSDVGRLSSGVAKFINNNAYRNGTPKQIHMRMRVDGLYSQTQASGVWSPDSV